MRLSYTLLLTMLTVCVSSMAQPIDSISKPLPWTSTFARSRIGQASMVSVPLALGSLAVRSEDSHFLSQGFMPQHTKHEYYLQYAPAVTLLSLKAAGVKGTSSWGEMLTADAFAVMFMGGAVEGFKHIIDADRPDGTDNHAYPSGHTATAFMTATMLHHEYGGKYPWLAVLGYGSATATGIMRIAQDRHSLSDVMAGASIGIMATELGYLVSDLIFHKSIFANIDEIGDTDDCCPSFIGYNAAFNVPTGAFRVYDDLRLKFSSGYSVGVEGAWFATPNMGIGAQASYSDLRFYANDVAQSETLSYMKCAAGVYLSLPTSRYFSVGAKAIGGMAWYDGIDVVCNIPAHGGVTYGCGAWCMMRAQQRLSYKIFCDIDRLPSMVSGAQRPVSIGIGLQMALTF